MKQSHFTPEFVETIPEDLDNRVLYVSLKFRTASHLCACGCGRKIVTPIKPPKWRFTYDGESISLSPSIGRWQSPCRSHYVIRDSEVIWSRAWTDEEITEGRDHDAALLREYYGRRQQESTAQPTADEDERSLLEHLRHYWRRIRRRSD